MAPKAQFAAMFFITYQVKSKDTDTSGAVSTLTYLSDALLRKKVARAPAIQPVDIREVFFHNLDVTNRIRIRQRVMQSAVNSGRSQSPEHPVLEKMSHRIQDWKNIGDNRGLFLSCYAAMTGNMIRAIENDEFEDPAWVKKLLERFADYYFEGLESCECGASDRPLVWDYAHRATVQCDLHIMQYLLLGINAHINYDLVLTLHEILKQEWQEATPEIRFVRQRDHLRVNDIIAATVDTVQDQIIEVQSPHMDILDKLIKKWRNEVWEEALTMLEIGDPLPLEHQRQVLEQKVIDLAERIMLR